MQRARSAFSRSFLASLRYMKTVMNGAWPLVVMRVTTWYWMVWTPRAISSRTRPSTIWETFSSPGVGADGGHLGLHLAADLLAAHVDEGREVRERDGLAAVLAGGNLGDDLRGDVAGGGEAVRALDERAGDHGAVLQHVLEVDEVAVVHVLREVVRVVEVDDALVVGLHDVGGEQLAHREVLGDLAGHVVALDRDHRGVLVGVLLLDLLVVALDEREDLVVGGVLVALLVLHVAVDDVLAGHLKVVERHQLVLDEVLDLLDGDGVA